MNILRTRRIALPLLLTALVSCGGDGPGTTEPDPPRAVSMSLSQNSLTFTYLGQTITLSATILDQFSQAFNGSVTWSTSDASVVTVGSTGVVTAVGNGSASIEATSGSLSVTAAVSVQQVATRVSVVSGDRQTGTVAQALAEPLVVRAQDQGETPVAGATVEFTLENGGSVSQASVTADADGLASTNWTLGPTAGTQRVTAKISGTNTGWAPMEATAQAGPAAALLKTSGDGQSAVVNTALSEPIVVTFADEFGNGLPGGTVTFAVTGGGGSVSPAQVTTGSDGTAQTTWTLGPGVGSNSLRASAGGFDPVDFTASAVAAAPDLTAEAPTTSPENPTTLETVDVTATVTNEGQLTTGSGFRVQLLVDGAAAASANLPALAPGASADATFTVGPLDAGSHILRVVADVDNTVVESNESNNVAQTTRNVAATTQISAGTPVSGLGAAEGTEMLFTLEIPSSHTGGLSVELSGGTGDVDMYVHHGDRPAAKEDYDCQSGNPDTDEQCIFNDAEPGTYHILLYAWSDYSGTTMLSTTGGAAVPFDIELVFIERGTAAQDAAVEEAAAIWMRVLTNDIPHQKFNVQPIDADGCTEGQPRIDDEVDDIRIYVRIDSIDGVSGTLAQAGPCVLRGLKAHPAVGVMTFDEDDLAALEAEGSMLAVVLHEMGHVLGFGTIWQTDEWDLLRNPSLPNNSGADTHFIGERAIAAFDDLGGNSTYTKGEKVPVENQAGEGSSDSHWRESVLGRELMTPFLNGGVLNPLSALTAASMVDIGYRVDMSQAQSFSVVFRSPARVGSLSRPIDLRGDIRTGAIFVVDPGGRLREVVRR